MLEILCLGIALVAGFQGQLVYRRMGSAQRPYAYLLLADAAAAVAGFFESRVRDGSRILEILGAASVFGFVCLVLVPPLLRTIARWAVARELLGLGAAVTSLREHLQPGFGARQEREMIDAIREVEAGHADAVLAELRVRRTAEPEPAVRRSLDDRIVLTLLYASRWREAIEVFEASRHGAPIPTGLQLLVEVVRAYGEEGDLEKAAEMVARLEELPAAREPGLAFLFARARMLFLAFAGRPAAVEALVSPRAPMAGLSRAMRAYWIGTARLHAGDRAGARAALLEAAGTSDGRVGRLARNRLQQVEDSSYVTPRAMPFETAALADRLAELAQETAVNVVRLEGLSLAVIPVTVALIAVNVAVHLVVSLGLGSTEDAAVLVRAGANFKRAVAAGEWWRLVSSTFLHVGALHVAVNMLALWTLGRLVEQIFGSARFFVVYALAGVGGALASYLFGASEVGLSAGASGAVFGVLGAAIAELWGRRRGAPGQPSERFRRALLSNLLFIAAINLAIGAAYPMIDQAAHVGGFVAGAAFGWALSNGRRVAPRLRLLARALAVVLAGVTLATGVLAATTPVAVTFDHIGWQRRALGGMSLSLPASWEVQEPSAVDHVFRVVVTVAKLAAVDANAFEQDLLQNVEVKDLTPAPPREVPGWKSRAFRYQAGDEWRLHFAHWREGAKAHLVRFDLPERDQRLLAPIMDRILASVTD